MSLDDFCAFVLAVHDYTLVTQLLSFRARAADLLAGLSDEHLRRHTGSATKHHKTHSGANLLGGGVSRHDSEQAM